MSDIIELKKKLDRVRAYKFNWNLNRTEPTSKTVIDNTEKLLDLLNDGGFWLPESADVDSFNQLSMDVEIKTDVGVVSLLIFEDEISFYVEFNDGTYEEYDVKTDFSEVPDVLAQFLKK